jgi:hypothetical protein
VSLDVAAGETLMVIVGAGGLRGIVGSGGKGGASEIGGRDDSGKNHWRRGGSRGFAVPVTQGVGVALATSPGLAASVGQWTF